VSLVGVKPATSHKENLKMETPDVQTPAPIAPAAAPSSAEQPTYEIPSDPVEYRQYQLTGKLPEKKPPSNGAAPASAQPKSKTDTSAVPTDEVDDTESAPAPDSGKSQEQHSQRRKVDAETEIRRLRARVKELEGKPPVQNKDVKPGAEPSPAQPKPQPALIEPKEPVLTDYTAEKYGDNEKAWLAYDKDSRQYARELAKYEAHKGIEEYKATEAQKAQAKALDDMISEAKTRRPDVVEIIVPTADAIFPDEQIPVVVKQMLASSKVYVDLLYVLGGDQAKLEAWIQKAKSDPGEAIREAILLESLVKDELGRGNGKAKTDAPPRDPASGRFQAENANPGKESTAPAPKKITGAPGPTAEVGGKATPPADPELSAVESGNMEAFTAERNRRDLETKKARR
jgi:hypothetical protein